MYFYISKQVFKRKHSTFGMKSQHGLTLLCVKNSASFYRQLCTEGNWVRQHLGCLRSGDGRCFRWDCLHEPALSRGSHLEPSLIGLSRPAVQHDPWAQSLQPRGKGPRSPATGGVQKPSSPTSCPAQHGTVSTTKRDLPAPSPPPGWVTAAVHQRKITSLCPSSNIWAVYAVLKTLRLSLCLGLQCYYPYWLQA